MLKNVEPSGSTHVRHMFDTSSTQPLHLGMMKSDANFGKKTIFRKPSGREQPGDLRNQSIITFSGERKNQASKLLTL
jgi:hypothetical protein